MQNNKASRACFTVLTKLNGSLNKTLTWIIVLLLLIRVLHYKKQNETKLVIIK